MGDRITSQQIRDRTDEDRYHRQRLISWWDQRRLADSRVLVVGAGALGNEILKLLALTGVGSVVAVDMDRIELSNLSRGVLFRDSDVGQYKTDCAARRAMELNPEVTVHAINCDILLQGGLGLFAWADVVVGAVDNREARVFINAACAATGRSWVDGAIQELAGVLRVFDPAHGACYECTMGETDRKLLAQRQSCARLAREAIALGHVPNTAIAASIIGSFQALEALKLLSGQPALRGEGLHVEGLGGEVFRISYPRRDDCMGHETLPPVQPLGLGVRQTTLGALLDRAEQELGAGAVLDLSRDVILSLSCPQCNTSTPGEAVVGMVSEAEAGCPDCGTHRVLDFCASISRETELDLERTPYSLGLPPLDIIVARQGLEHRRAWVFDGDADEVLGPLAKTLDLDPQSQSITDQEPPQQDERP